MLVEELCLQAAPDQELRFDDILVNKPTGLP